MIPVLSGFVFFIIRFLLQSIENEGRYYECDLLPFMEVGTVSHKYYLVNIRLPVYERKKVNVGIGEIKDIRLVVRIRHVYATYAIYVPISVPTALH